MLKEKNYLSAEDMIELDAKREFIPLTFDGMFKGLFKKDLDLLKDVVAFKKKFYRCPWAKYEEAVPGSVKLIPSEQYFPELQKDYSKMKNMIYGIVPSFDQIIEGIRKLETEINLL